MTDRSDDGALQKDEVYRRMPALRLIKDDDLRHVTAQLTASAPPYFWDVPASTSGYHHELCRGQHGLWAHTLMVVTVAERLLPSYQERGLLDAIESDYARAAAILHDQRKNGPADSPSESSVANHDLLMADVAREAGLPDRLADAIASHMGPWYDGPDPGTPLDELVHNADMVASTETVTPAVQSPAPVELAELGVTEVDLQ